MSKRAAAVQLTADNYMEESEATEQVRSRPRSAHLLRLSSRIACVVRVYWSKSDFSVLFLRLGNLKWPARKRYSRECK